VNIFSQADRNRLRSIAIPAIGTGNLRIPHAVVTHVMYEEVLKFSRAKPATTLKDIRFVVYDKDLPTLKVNCQFFLLWHFAVSTVVICCQSLVSVLPVVLYSYCQLSLLFASVKCQTESCGFMPCCQCGFMTAW